MDRCKLVKPDLSYEKDILAYRQEMLDANSSMDGTGPLRRMDRVQDWLDFNRKLENKDTSPADLVPADQYVYVRETDNKIVGMIFAKSTAATAAIRSGQAREGKGTRRECFPTACRSVRLSGWRKS